MNEMNQKTLDLEPIVEQEMTMKKCCRCGKLKSINEFYRNKYQRDGYQLWCKECAKEFKRKVKDTSGNTSLKGFSSRNLLKELWERGYRWEAQGIRVTKFVKPFN